MVAKNIHVGSSVAYMIFGADGHSQSSFTIMKMNLKSSNSGSVPPPSNPKTFNDLKFVFENDVKEDEDLGNPVPFFFHHKGLDLDSAGQTKAADQVRYDLIVYHMKYGIS